MPTTDDGGDDSTDSTAAHDGGPAHPLATREEDAEGPPPGTSGNPRFDGDAAEWERVMEEAAEKAAPDPDAVAERREARRRREAAESAVSWSEADARDAKRSHDEKILHELSKIAEGDTPGGSPVAKADGSGEGEGPPDGRHSQHEEDLISEVANVLGVSEGTARDGFDALRNDDSPEEDFEALVAAVSEHLGVPESEVRDELQDLRDGDRHNGEGDLEKCTVKKTVGTSGLAVGTNEHGEPAVLAGDGRSVPLDALVEGA